MRNYAIILNKEANMEATLVTYVLAALGGLTLAGALGLLAKHLTLDHQSIDRRLDRIIELLKEEERVHNTIVKDLEEIKTKLK